MSYGRLNRLGRWLGGQLLTGAEMSSRATRQIHFSSCVERCSRGRIEAARNKKKKRVSSSIFFLVGLSFFFVRREMNRIRKKLRIPSGEEGANA